MAVDNSHRIYEKRKKNDFVITPVCFKSFRTSIHAKNNNVDKKARAHLTPHSIIAASVYYTRLVEICPLDYIFSFLLRVAYNIIIFNQRRRWTVLYYLSIKISKTRLASNLQRFRR